MHKRMGEEVRLNFALLVTLAQKSLGYLERKCRACVTTGDRKDMVKIAMFFVLTF